MAGYPIMPSAFDIEVNVYAWYDDDVEVRIRHLNELEKINVTIVYEYGDPYHAYGVIPADWRLVKAIWNLDADEILRLLEKDYDLDVEFGYNTIEFTAPRA